MSQPSWDYIAKLVCIGDSGTGKSSLTIRLCEGRFSPHHDVTIGVEFGSRIVPVGPPASSTLQRSSSSTPSSPSSPPLPVPLEAQKYMKLSLWDTAGQETYASVTRSYFRGASGALLVFSLTRRSSFLSVTKWLNDLRQIADPDIVVVLVGNKSDLSGQDGQEGKREVETAEAEQWCKQNGVLQYVETSAKSGVGVESAFREVAEKIYENVGKGRYDLNDRRSGVKGPGAGGTRRGGGVSLGMNDAAKKGGSGWSGGCC